MLKHLQLATKLGDEVDAMENDALQILGILAITNTVQAYRMKAHFEHNALYRQRGGARNLHVSLATMYGIAALVEQQQTLATYRPEVF